MYSSGTMLTENKYAFIGERKLVRIAVQTFVRIGRFRVSGRAIRTNIHLVPCKTESKFTLNNYKEITAMLRTQTYTKLASLLFYPISLYNLKARNFILTNVGPTSFLNSAKRPVTL